MQVGEQVSLKPHNTFSIDARARFFAQFTNAGELTQLLTNFKQHRKMILGGGSNVLFVKDYDGIVLKNECRGIQKIKEDTESVYISAGAGENWHRFVLHCIENNWAGVENLSLIPGNVGATPMQNIGAYGVEIKNVFHELKAFHIHEKTNYTFTLNDCDFGYRDSVFKKKYKDQFVILEVTYCLSKKPHFNTSYGAIEQELEKMGVKQLSIKAVSDAVIHIRSSRLPDPREIGNAGSFFKNPTVEATFFEKLRSAFPGIVGYKNPDSSIKLAAGWLIEACGWKGFRRGDVGCHGKQALVLVNYGNANGAEVNLLADEIKASIWSKFQVDLEKEVNVI